MRTTITLDDDVAAKLKADMRASGVSFKEAVNNALRKGLTYSEKDLGPVRPVKFNNKPLVLRPGLSFDNISELLEETEGPFHR